MAILNNNPLIGSGGNQGYNINNSLRFRQSASATLSRTPASASNRQTWTWSGWVKRGRLGVENHGLFAGRTSASATYTLFVFSDTNTLWFLDNAGASLVTTAVYRDPSAWYHIVLSVDTTQATASNRVRIYVNGVQVTAFSTATYPTQNANLNVNTTATQVIGDNPGASQFFDGYMAEVNFIDGSAKTPSDFGETDTTTGVWKPKAYTGTYGTNGFYLKFSDIATTSGSNAGLGKDFSGNGNYWTTNNISVTSGTTYDAMTDSPTNTSATVANYPTWNPLKVYSSSLTISNGNLTATDTTSNIASRIASMALPTTGKWYFEITATTISASLGMVGVIDSTVAFGTSSFQNKGQYRSGGQIYNLAGTAQTSGSTYTSGDVIGIAVDVDAGNVQFYKNNVAQGGTPSFTFTTGTELYPSVSTDNNAGTKTFDANFGQRPFSYTPPTGFVALNTFNLPTSTILQGNKYMDATIWTGDGNTSRTITNAASFKPDFVWLKERDIAIDHILYDSIRGPSTSSASKALCSNTTVVEGSQNDNSTYGYLDGFTSSGFTVTRGSDGATSYTNKNNGTYVGWQWQAGQGTTSSNTAGTITSTVSANTTAGFSIVTYTGNGTAGATVGHGLGVSPAMTIIKSRLIAANSWCVWQKSFSTTQTLYLDSTTSLLTRDRMTGVSNTTFTIGSHTEVNTNASTYVAYCFAEIAGFSKAFSYTGNGSADGPFVYTGFRPKFMMMKRTDSTGDWYMVDSSRATYNQIGPGLNPNTSSAEFTLGSPTGGALDFLSNGFKWRGTYIDMNANGGTYIGIAFAENPFKNSLAR